MLRLVRPSIACALSVFLAGCPSSEPETPSPSTGTSTPTPPATADPTEAPQDVTPSPVAAPTDGPGAAEARAWKALGQATPWARLLVGKLKSPEEQAKLEAPLNAQDSTPIRRLALLVRYSPIQDAETRQVLNITVPLRRMLSKSAGLGLGSFAPDDPRTTALVALPDATLMGSARWLRTPKGQWVSVSEGVASGAWSRDLACDLRAAIEHARAARWDQAIPLYQAVFDQLARTNSDLQGPVAQEKWKAVLAQDPQDLDAYQGALDAWWRVFVGPKPAR